LLAPFAPAGLPNPAAWPLDGNQRLHAIQREQNTTDGGRQTSNTLQGDRRIVGWEEMRLILKSNVTASDLPPLTDEQMAGVKAVYEEYIKDPVHYLW
jgi:hypothetical protein